MRSCVRPVIMARVRLQNPARPITTTYITATSTNQRLNCVWLWLNHRHDPLETAIRNAGARLLIPEEEAVRRIREHLQASGVQP